MTPDHVAVMFSTELRKSQRLVVGGRRFDSPRLHVKVSLGKNFGQKHLMNALKSSKFWLSSVVTCDPGECVTEHVAQQDHDVSLLLKVEGSIPERWKVAAMLTLMNNTDLFQHRSSK